MLGLEAEKPGLVGCGLGLAGFGLGLVGFGLEPLEAYSRNGTECDWKLNQYRILRSLSCRCELQASLTLNVKTFIHKNIRQPNL